MLETKTRIQGKSVVVTLPTQKGKSPESGKEYLVSYGSRGEIILVPKIQNPFLNVQTGKFYEEDTLEDLQPVGGEEINDIYS